MVPSALHFTLLFLCSPGVHLWVMRGIHFELLFFCFPPFSQVTRAQYQNGLLASKLDSTPQSPQSSHIRLDSMLAPPLTPPTSSTTYSTAPGSLQEGPNETTTLLNDKNSLNSHRATQTQSYSNSNSNSNLNTSANTNSSPHPLSNNHPQSLSYPNNPSTQTPHLHIHISHAHTESTIWQNTWGAVVGAKLQRGPHWSINTRIHTNKSKCVHGHLQSICNRTQKHLHTWTLEQALSFLPTLPAWQLMSSLMGFQWNLDVYSKRL